MENSEQIQSKFRKISYNTSSFDKHKFLLYLLQKRALKTYKFDMWLQPIKNRMINLQKLKANSHNSKTS